MKLTFLATFAALLVAVSASAATYRIGFVSTRSGNEEIWVMDADGANPVQLTSTGRDKRGDTTPSWSPDGTLIAFATYRYDGWKIAAMNNDGSDIHRLTQNDDKVYEDYPRWSRDGRKVCFVRYRKEPGIYVMRSDGSRMTRLTDNSKDKAQEVTGQPSWTPDGRVLFASKESGDKQDDDYDIWVIDANRANKTALTSHMSDEISPVMSPDGKRIACYSNIGGAFNVAIMNANGSGMRPLRDDKDNPREFESQETFYSLQVSWSPDGRQLAYVTFVDEQYDIFVMSPKGTNAVQLTGPEGDDTLPVWLPVVD